MIIEQSKHTFLYFITTVGTLYWLKFFETTIHLYFVSSTLREMYYILLPVISTALSLTGSFFVGVVMITVLRQVNVINTCQIRVTSNMVIIIAIHIKVKVYVMTNFLAL